jgi:hypothetical protein
LEKMMPTKISMFLYHCLGRIERITLLSIGSAHVIILDVVSYDITFIVFTLY